MLMVRPPGLPFPGRKALALGMLFFVVFVITHVAMVFATGALRNLNHMFAGAESTNWAGFWIFVVALAVIATVWELARPMVLAPIARLLGRVTQR